MTTLFYAAFKRYQFSFGSVFPFLLESQCLKRLSSGGKVGDCGLALSGGVGLLGDVAILGAEMGKLDSGATLEASDCVELGESLGRNQFRKGVVRGDKVGGCEIGASDGVVVVGEKVGGELGKADVCAVGASDGVVLGDALTELGKVDGCAL